MKAPFGVRLWILILALIAVVGGTIHELSSDRHRVQRLEATLTTSQFESFKLAGRVQRELLNLNDALLRYVLVRDDGQWRQFDRAANNLDKWTDDYDPAMNEHSPLTTDRERRVFTKLNQAYTDYLKSARAVHTNAVPALLNAGQLTQLNAFDKQAANMQDLAQKLADAHRLAEQGFLASTNAALTNLQNILTVGVLIILILVAAMGWVIYRDTVAPLRIKLVQSQTLLEKQEKLATLGTLAAGIAHEIRNPLTSLKARLYTLEKHLQLVPNARKDTDIISAEISRLERIVRDVLNFARPSDPKLETVAADTLFQEVQGLMSPSLESRGVHLLVEGRPDTFVRVDTGHLKQVLINLVRNAADAIDGAGKIILRTETSRTRLRGRETEVVILEVADDGKGIPPDVEQRLFDPFYSTKETGTGLGLPIAARIVEKHGGMLRYQTQPGRGTTFGIVLPREFQHHPARATSEAASPI